MRIAARLVGLVVGPALGLVGMAVVAATTGCEQGGSASPVVNQPVASQAPAAATQAPAVVTADAESQIAVKPKAPVKISFDPPQLDFGFVEPGRDMRGNVAIRNEGSEPATIVSIKPTCKCTALNDLSGTVIQPGSFANLDVVLEGRSVTGRRGAQIRIVIDGAPAAYTVDVSSEVTLGIRVNPSVLNMAPPKTGDPITTRGFVTIESVDGTPFNILATNGQPPKFVEFDPELDEPRSTYLIEWDLTEQEASAALPRWWVIETDLPDCEIVDAWVRHPRTIRRPPPNRPWSVPDLRVMAGHLVAGQPKNIDIRIKDVAGDEINAVRSLSSVLDVALVGYDRVGPDAICTVRVTPKSGSSGVVVAEIELISIGYTHQMDVVGKISP